jgi:predicted DNA-binding transcriptional regulator YafY
MADPGARLLRLLGLLQRRATWSGTDLAERLEVDVRTLRRDVEKLRVLGYQIDGTPGATGGYRLGGGTEVPPLLFDDEEAMAVAVVLGASAVYAVPGIEHGVLAALAKLDRLLPTRLRDQLRALRAATVPLVSPTEMVSTECLVQLAQASEYHLRVAFSYTVPEGRKSERRVEPHRIVATERRWYLVAFDLDRDDWRTFRVDRITSVTVPGHTFVPRRLDDPAQMVAVGISTAPYRHRAVAVLDARFSDVAPLVDPYVAVLHGEGSQTRVELGYDELAWVAGYLIGLGLDFEILEPPELRRHITLLGRRLSSVHRSAADG